MMEGMRILQLIFIILVLLYHYGIDGQVTAPLSTAAALGDDVSLVCTTEENSPTFVWVDGDTGQTIFFGDVKDSSSPEHLNVELGTSNDPQRSVLNIDTIEFDDDGNYTCRLTGQPLEDAEPTKVTVEVRYTLELSVASPLVNGTTYRATCNALNGRPDLPITWMLGDGGSPCDSREDDTSPGDEEGLFSKSSVCTFQADSENNDKALKCIISGHKVPGLDTENTTTLVIHSAPRTGIITIHFQPQESNLRVSCDIDAADQPNPSITDYYIISNGSMIHQPDAGNNFVDVELPDFITDFLCVAGNYLGNTTSKATYDPSGPTTLPTPTEPITTEGPTTEEPKDLMTSPGPNDDRNNTARRSGPGGLSAGAIAGIAIGAVLLIVIIVLIIYFVCIRGKDGSDGGNPPPRKHPSAVGTSNGSEKDKIKPVAAPRDQGSIQHTTDNPGQAEYAMVDRKKPGGGDLPDTRGPGQKEPQGMLYADLDLSASAGHTEKKVPQNKDDVVVYSSILV